MANKKKFNKAVQTEKLGTGITMTTTVISKADALDEVLNNDIDFNESIDESTDNNIVPEQMVVMPKNRQPIGEVTSTEILVIDRINGFTYVKEGKLRKNYNSVQYKVDNPYDPKTAEVSADGVDIGVLEIEFIGKEKHQLSQVEMDELAEESIKRENFVVKG